MPCNFIFYFSVNLCSLFLLCFICLVEMQHDSILKFQSNTIHLIIRNLNLPFTLTSFSAFLKIPGTIFANLTVSLITCQSDKANLLIKETLEILNLYIYIYISGLIQLTICVNVIDLYSCHVISPSSLSRLLRMVSCSFYNAIKKIINYHFWLFIIIFFWGINKLYIIIM